MGESGRGGWAGFPRLAGASPRCIPLWRIPTGEPTALIQETEAAPLPAIGIDGSQIYPRAESPVRWAYIQALACWRGATPELRPEFLDLSDQDNENDEDGKEEEYATSKLRLKKLMR